mgnify:CR=1 FL=1
MKDKVIGRRDVLKGGGAALLTTVAALSGCKLSSSSKAPDDSSPTPPSGGTVPLPTTLSVTPANKSLVFVMLDGGQDSFNMLIPNSAADYNEYQAVRKGLAIPKNELLPLNGFTDARGKSFGLHPSAPELKTLFDQEKLAFVANIGPMTERLDRAKFLAGSASLPVGLMSHSDQFKHWQTSNPGKRVNRGWFGDFADVIQPSKADNKISMNISLAGSNIMQNGKESTEYAVTKKGSVGLTISSNDPAAPDAQLRNALKAGFESMLSNNYANAPFQDRFLSTVRSAQAQHQVFTDSISNIIINSNFSEHELSQQLKMVAKTIAARHRLGMNQQTFFVRYIGWDHHDELLVNHKRMLAVLSKALGEFQAALANLGLEDEVVTFSGSDFGRTLTSNGNGSDHGWGGNTIVMGTPVKGGKVYGEFPSLALKSNLDAGDGIMIPTTSTDQLYAELAMWFGVDKLALPLLFPNISNFYDVRSSQAPLGMINGVV